MKPYNNIVITQTDQVHYEVQHSLDNHFHYIDVWL
jgi:hypothetical protein